MYGEIGVDSERRIDWAGLRAYRLQRLRERLAAAGIDGVLGRCCHGRRGRRADAEPLRREARRLS